MTDTPVSRKGRRYDAQAIRAALLNWAANYPPTQFLTLRDAARAVDISNASASKEIKVLRAANQWPWPQGTGLKMRSHIVLRAMPRIIREDRGNAQALLHGVQIKPKVDHAAIARRAEIKAMARINRANRKVVAG